MFIIVSIYSKNLNSLTNFLKFFYKLKKNQTLKIKFHSVQSQKKKKFSFFSTLQSPHVNKKSQEQFEYHIYSKKLKIHVSQITKFLVVWKTVKMTLFPDIKIKTLFCLKNRAFNCILGSKINLDTFKLATFFKPTINHLRCLQLSSATINTSITLFDIRGEILLKTLSKSLDSSVGRAKD